MPDGKRSAAAANLEARVSDRHAVMESERVARRANELAGSGEVKFKATVTASQDKRTRTITLRKDTGTALTPGQVQRIYDAMAIGGEDAANDAFRAALEEAYFGGAVGAEIDELEWIEFL